MLETGDLFDKSKTCCTTAQVRRNVVLDLQNNKDPLAIYAQSHIKPFGMDTTFRTPVENAPNEKLCTSKTIPLMQRFAEIRQHGNNIRKTIVPDTDSPVKENVTKEMFAGTARFFEAGR